MPFRPTVYDPMTAASGGNVGGLITYSSGQAVGGFTDPTDAPSRVATYAINDIIDQNPYLQEQYKALTDIASRRGEVAARREAGETALRQSDVDRAALSRRVKTLDLSKRQLAGIQKRGGLTRAIARAGASEAVGRGFERRGRAARGMMGSFSDADLATRMDIALGESAIESAEQAAAAQRKANKKSSTLGLIGQIGGIALGAMLSSESVKDNHGKADGLLAKLKNVRVNRWNYKGDGQTHIGPFAEEFNKELGLKTENPGLISIVDAIGVTLGAVKELNDKVEARG